MVVDECEKEWRLVFHLTGDDCPLHVALALLSWGPRCEPRKLCFKSAAGAEKK